MKIKQSLTKAALSTAMDYISGDPENNLPKLLSFIEGIPDNRIIPVGAAIGTHIGPNACGIVYIAKETNCGK